MSEFHNPYHFVPAPEARGPGTVPRDPAEWPAHLTHDRYVAQTHSDGASEQCYTGRLVVRLEVEESLLVGGAQDSSRPPRSVEAFKLPNGDLAIPSTSLRGMTSQVFEAISNSTLRVLEKTVKSGRFTMVENIYDFFRNPETDPAGEATHLIPLQAGDGRKFLTLAEAFFGLVERSASDQSNLKARHLSLASRVRFFHGLATRPTPRGNTAETTKILDSPKARYPSFYYNTRDDPEGSFIRKEQTLDPETLRAKGRKFYLHRKQLKPVDWQTEDPNTRPDQKSLFRPLAKGAVFWFHIDFTNASELELEALCYSIRPTPSFRHKLGAGKPLGLGKVALDPAALLTTDRARRYRADSLSDPRWHRSWINSQLLAGSPYENPHFAEHDDTLDPSVLSSAYSGRIHAEQSAYPHLRDSLEALLLIGDPTRLTDSPVMYPQLPHQEPEVDIYKWFQQNEASIGQYLRSLRSGLSKLPTLFQGAHPSPPDAGVGGVSRPGPRIPSPEPSPPPIDIGADPEAVRAYSFFLGGTDLEMETISRILRGAEAPFEDRKLAWQDAGASQYETEIRQAVQQGLRPVLVELRDDLDPNLREKVQWIDHHGDSAGEERPSSLRQIFELLRGSPDKWSRELELVDVNDIQGLEGLLQVEGVSPEVAQRLRQRDLALQGMTPEEMQEVRSSLLKASTTPWAPGTCLVQLPTCNRATAVADLVFTQTQKWKNVVIQSPTEINFFGKGAVVIRLRQDVEPSIQNQTWSGGALPARGFWGLALKGQETKEILSMIQQTIVAVRKAEKGQ